MLIQVLVIPKEYIQLHKNVKTVMPTTLNSLWVCYHPKDCMIVIGGLSHEAWKELLQWVAVEKKMEIAPPRLSNK